ncbi:hypothetical protein [Streptomyces sp. NPDC057616]|uniref:hypothetical protein n=1 Tax=Streptomyces sp. NPDC057616 TaxID=3346183 RepID=UPI00369A0624
MTAVRIAGELVGIDSSQVALETFRMWRVRCLPEVLRPDAPSREGVKESLRSYAHELELLVASDEAGREVTRVSEELLARDVFGPLGGVVDVGAVNATGSWQLADVSVGDFLARRQEDVERLRAAIRSLCGFGDPVMAIADELGWLRDHQVSGVSLLLWSGGAAGAPRSLEGLERLDDPSVVRRMCRVAADLQLTRFLQGVIAAAVAAGTDVSRGAPKVVEVLDYGADLAGGSVGRGVRPAEIFRMWRVAHLPGLLEPGSGAEEDDKARLRAYEQALDGLLGVGVGADGLE